MLRFLFCFPKGTAELPPCIANAVCLETLSLCSLPQPHPCIRFLFKVGLLIFFGANCTASRGGGGEEFSPWYLLSVFHGDGTEIDLGLSFPRKD